MRRVIWIILDSVGIGQLPDSQEYGDVGTHTLQHVYEYNNGLNIPNMLRLGLGNIQGSNLPECSNPIGIYGKAMEISKGKDTTTGHWEMVGINTRIPFPTYPKGFSKEIIDEFLDKSGLKAKGIDIVLGNCTASGTAIIKELGEEHLATKAPIVYTSADSVFQIACNDNIYTKEELYKLCECAREILVGENQVARVIARPFTGKNSEEFVRTSARRDFSATPPRNNLLSYLQNIGVKVYGVGKIEDIFAGQGIYEAIHTRDNEDGMEVTMNYMDKVEEGLIFTNLVEFDSKWGHRNDPEGYGKGLESFDKGLGMLLERLTEEDLLIINADHGCDPITPGTDHTREYIPILIYNKNLKKGKDIGVRATFADIGQTIGDIFETKKLDIGTSLLNEINNCY